MLRETSCKRRWRSSRSPAALAKSARELIALRKEDDKAGVVAATLGALPSVLGVAAEAEPAPRAHFAVPVASTEEDWENSTDSAETNEGVR